MAQFLGIKGRGKKGQISLNFNYKVISNIFKPNFVCLLTNERFKTYKTEFSFHRLDHAQGAGLGQNKNCQNSTKFGV